VIRGFHADLRSARRKIMKEIIGRHVGYMQRHEVETRVAIHRRGPTPGLYAAAA